MYPNCLLAWLRNGKLVIWANKVISIDICYKTTNIIWEHIPRRIHTLPVPFQHSWSQAWVKEERSQRQKGEGCNRLGKLRWKPNHSYEPRENRWGIKENGVVFATVHWNYRSFSLHGDSCWVVSSYPNSTGVGTCFWKIWKMIRPHLTDIQQQNLTHVICLSFCLAWLKCISSAQFPKLLWETIS